MLSMLRVGQAVLSHINDNEDFEGWTILMRQDHRGFRLQVPFGNVNVLATDEGEAGWLWQMLPTPGHRTEAAASIARAHNAADHLIGAFYLDPIALDPMTSESAETEHWFGYTVYLDNNTAGIDEEAFAAALISDVINLAAVLDTYEGFVRARHTSDEAIAAHEKAWPTAAAALLDDATPVGMLNILFQCFEENSIHEHVFYHPNADAALRHRIVASWDRIAADDRPQPYGDPDAASSSSAQERDASVAYLRKTLS